MQFDMEIAREISERITEQHEQAKSNRGNGGSRSAKRAVAKRNQRRAAMQNQAEVGNAVDKWLSGE